MTSLDGTNREPQSLHEKARRGPRSHRASLNLNGAASCAAFRSEFPAENSTSVPRVGAAQTAPCYVGKKYGLPDETRG
jgi:hypothetical protein